MFKDYPSYISEKRRPIASPPDLVDKDGKCVFGTFDTPLERMSFLDCKKPRGKRLPHSMNKTKLTVWEAVELHFDDFIFLTAVYNLGIAGFNIFVYFDKKTAKIKSWMAPVLGGKRAKVAETLLNGATTELSKGKNSVKIVNDYQDKKARCVGKASSKKHGELSFDVNLKVISKPSIVNIPFGENTPLYSEKDLFAVEGSLTIDGKTYQATESTFGIIDDHKGYYPKFAHYDWLTTMTLLDIDGEKKPFGFNLTRNQSINQDDYNENLLWFEGDACPLPPVHFSHCEDGRIWSMKDEHGAIDLKFQPENQFKIVVNVGFIKVLYYLPFGKINGTLKDTNGKEYKLVDIYGLGEDKTTLM